MLNFGVFFLFFLSVVIGFTAGYWSKSKKKPQSPELPWTQKRYVEGLTYLLNEQTDESLDAFIAKMDVSPQTLDVHLSLGSLLRRKGEFARALKVHENLLIHQRLSVEDLNLVKFELAKDFFASGLLDRAEISLCELINTSAIGRSLRQEALEKLVVVYQETKDWLKAIDVADQLTEKKFAGQPDKWREYQAQYSCELAELGRKNKDWQETRHWAMAAQRYDKNCVRATLLLAQIDMEEDKYPAAIATLKKIPLQNSVHISEMLMPLVQCYRKSGSDEQLIEELKSYLNMIPDAKGLKILFDLLRDRGQLREALHTLCQFASSFSSHHEIFELSGVVDNEQDLNSQLLTRFTDKLSEMLVDSRYYLCGQCGWEAKEMHWLCPSCNRWATLALQ